MQGLIFIALLAAVEPQTNPKTNSVFQEKIEAKVGGAIITSTDLKLMEDGMKAIRPTDDVNAIHKRALDTLVDQALISEYLKKNSMEVNDREVTQQINAIRTQYGIKTEDQFRQMLEKQGVNFDRFKAQIKSQKELAQFRALIATKVPEPTETELIEYYRSNSDTFKKNPEVQLSECVIPFGKDPKLAEKRASEYQAKPNKFSECIKKYSQSPSAAQNGVLGKFQRGMLRDDIEAKVFALKANDVLKLPTEGGIQLIKIDKVTNLGPVPYQKARDSIRQAVKSERTQKEIDRVLTELKSSPSIQVLNR